MKKLLSFFIFCLFTWQTNAQQLTLSSQYMFNDYMINPAIAGTKYHNILHGSIRRQWVGIKEAPVTQFISGHGYLGYNLGFGGMLFNEASGPTRRTGMAFSTAYHLLIKKKRDGNQHTLSFGISGIIAQHYLDKDNLVTYYPNDPTIAAAYSSQTIPDVSFGFYYHNLDKYYIGLSCLNIIQSKTDLYNIPNPVNNFFVRNYYLTGGGVMQVNNKFTLNPSFLLRGIEAGPVLQCDLNLRGTYLKKYWAGASYRHKDAIATMIGVHFQEMSIGYSYDITLSAIRGYSAGSHEITCILLLDKIGQNFYKTNPGQYRMKKGTYKPSRSL